MPDNISHQSAARTRITSLLGLAAAALIAACAAKPPGQQGLVGRYSPSGGTASPAAGTGGSNNVSTPVLTGASGVAANAATVMMKPAGAGSTTPVSPSGVSGANRLPMPIVIDETGGDNPAGLSPAEVTKLVAGGPPGAMKWLYPYDGTVFPGGTIAPLVMWTGNPAPDAVYLHLKSQAFEYKGVLAPSTEGALFLPEGTTFLASVTVFGTTSLASTNKQLAIPQTAWDAASQRSLGKADTLLLEVTERVNGQIHGPVTSHITIARGALQGSIYYDVCLGASSTSDAPTFEASAGFGSRVMRIPPAGNAEVVSDVSQCIGCHSVSANGSRMIAQRGVTATESIAASLEGLSNYTYALSVPFDSDGKPNSKAGTHIPTALGAYGALYPDGSKYLAAASGEIKAGYLNILYSYVPPSTASLVDTMTGMAVSETGIPPSVLMPMFSPDGTRLVFNDMNVDGARGLAVMNYDTHNHKASNYKVLMQTAAGGAARPGWPFFLPDNRAVVFLQTTSEDFTSSEGGGATLTTTLNFNGDTAAPFPSDLYIADLATGKVTILAKAMGFNTPADAASGSTYLPFPLGDLHRSYYPTVSPVASGGYFWVFFDSVRHFGSIGVMRMLWGAAIDIHPDGSYTTDPSHPPFFLPGQEFVSTSHHRAFAALDHCKADGDKCATGIDCCAGACNDFGICAVPPPNTCAKVQERCASAVDCCDSGNYCINGFCSLVELL